MFKSKIKKLDNKTFYIAISSVVSIGLIVTGIFLGTRTSDANAIETCAAKCTFTIQDGDRVYDVVSNLSGVGHYYCEQGLTNCNLMRPLILKNISPDKLSFTGGTRCDDCHDCPTCTCGNENHISYSINANVRNIRGGGAGCPSAEYYCDVTKKCIPVLEVCNPAVADYVPDKINPNIPAQLGPVSLKQLKITPPLGNPGYTCRIEWNNAFASYDNATHCIFTGPNNTSISFSPASTTAPLLFTSENITTDTVFKMTCKEEDTGTTQSTEAVCRLNWNSKEIN